MRPGCTHDESRVCPPGEAFDMARHCGLCQLYHTRDDYNRAWGGKGIRHGPCRHLGEETRRVLCPTCRGHVELKVFACAKYGECTALKPVEGVKGCCQGCKDYAAPSPCVEWISTAALARDAVTLSGMLPVGLAGVVGVPRSGMIPAAVIACQLHLPLFELRPGGAEPVAVRPIGHGRGPMPPRGETLAVVDDTIFSGGAMGRARVWMKGRKCVYAVVYATPLGSAVVDYYARQILPPHLLEWNLGNNTGWAVAFDFDGVLTVQDTDRPWFLPRARPTPLIATGRHESARPHTEAWLRRWGVRWERLEMLPDGEPQTVERVAVHKADAYGRSQAHVFVESESEQAEIIHNLTKRLVVCPKAGRVWQ